MAGREWADAEYSRIYWTVVEDPKFADVYDDDRRWAAYTRLLMAAEATYPSPAPLPRWLADDVMEALVEARIIEVLRGTSYRVVGLRTEREGRATGRWIGGKSRAEDAERDDKGRYLPSQPRVHGESSNLSSNIADGAQQEDQQTQQLPATRPATGPANPAGTLLDSPADPGKTRTRTRTRTSTRDSPPPPASGGRPSRANGTSTRQVAAAEQAARASSAAAKRWRAQQRAQAYYRGAITESDQVAMDQRDASLEEIPDWLEHLTTLGREPDWIQPPEPTS